MVFNSKKGLGIRGMDPLLLLWLYVNFKLVYFEIILKYGINSLLVFCQKDNGSRQRSR